jgi:hypothetical protein
VDLISFVHYQEEMASRRQQSHHVKDLKPSAGNIQLNSPLHLLFEAAFIRHKEGRDGGFVAILGTPQGKSNPEQRKFYENLVKNGADTTLAAKNTKIGKKADALNINGQFGFLQYGTPMLFLSKMSFPKSNLDIC